ncbi:MAG: hypothetical protein KAU14_08765, partial [Thermoplasmata archaeon]|nr:hypothetical protein [Thermoplasmata archaeon]
DHPKMRDNLLVSLDIKCPSSGEEKKMDLDNLGLLTLGDQLKFVVKDLKDIEYAYKILHENPVPCPVIIQPASSGEYSRKELKEMASAILKTRFQGMDIRFMLQLHRLIYGKRRGV